MKKVLVCDEATVIRDLLRNVLRYYECEVHLVKSTESFLKNTKDYAYDLIFLDLDLTDADLRGVLEQVRSGSGNKNTPLVGLTGMNAFEVNGEGVYQPLHAFMGELESSTNTILKKPFSMVELSDLLEGFSFVKKKSFRDDFELRDNSDPFLKESILVCERDKNITPVLESTNQYDVHHVPDHDLLIRIYARKHYLFSVVIMEASASEAWDATLKQLISISPLPNVLLVLEEDDVDLTIMTAKMGISGLLKKTSESTEILTTIQSVQRTPITSPRRMEVIQSWVNEHHIPSEELLKRLIWKLSMENRNSHENTLMNLFYGMDESELSLKVVQRQTEVYLKKKIIRCRKTSLLVVEDEGYYRKLLYYLLKPTYKVYVAEDPRQAQQILNQHGPIDQMILDMYLPGKMGDDFFMEIKKQHPDMLVLIVTAYKELPKAFHLLQHGVVDYLNKPFKSIDLFKALGATWLSKRWPQIKNRLAWYGLSHWDRLLFLSRLLQEKKDGKQAFVMNDFYALFPEILEKDLVGSANKL